MENTFAEQGAFIAPRRYEEVSKTKSDGATYTPPQLAGFVADRMLEAFTPPDRVFRVLDPAGGNGALLVAFLARLSPSALALVEVVAFDTDLAALVSMGERIRAQFPKVRLTVENTDFLTHALERRSGGLLNFGDERTFDYVISNPPYVRTQILGAKVAQALAVSFGLAGRVDLFQPFILAIADVLAPGGAAGIIVSNRMMTTKGCSALRRGIMSRFRMIHAWDLGDSKPFGAAVLPAVLLATTPGLGDTPLMTTLYECKEPENAGKVENPLDALLLPNGTVVSTPGGKLEKRFLVKAGTLDNGDDPEGVWRVATPSTDDWLASVTARTWGTFGSIGKIRVGVKTTADKIFIRDDWDDLPEGAPELLRSLTTRTSARRFVPVVPEKPVRILYTHESGLKGRKIVINLEKHPKSAAYLEAHRSPLEARKYVIKARRRWYEIWVPQDPAAWVRQKLVFPDISEKPIFWIEEGQVVNGDCYWLLPQDGVDPDLIWLALAIGNSTFAEEFYDHRFNNKLYAGRRRFITQYVQEFPIPDPALPLSREIAATARRVMALTPSAEGDSLAAVLDGMVRNAFGL